MRLVYLAVALITAALIAYKYHDMTRALLLARAGRRRVDAAEALKAFKASRDLVASNVVATLGLQVAVAVLFFHGSLPGWGLYTGIGIGASLFAIGLVLNLIATLRVFRAAFGDGA